MRRGGIAVAFSLALLGATSATTAQACSIIITDHSPQADRRRAKEAVETATAIVDGEVVRPFVRGRQTALIRAHRVLKGPDQTTFELDAPTSCNTEFGQVGLKMRFFLGGGPEVYFEVAPSASAKRIDAILGSDRRKDWPYSPGVGP